MRNIIYVKIDKDNKTIDVDKLTLKDILDSSIIQSILGEKFTEFLVLELVGNEDSGKAIRNKLMHNNFRELNIKIDISLVLNLYCLLITIINQVFRYEEDLYNKK
jgi:hypothetical protein